MKYLITASWLFLITYGFAQSPSDYFTAAEIANSNTAIDEDYLSQEEKNIYLYSNLARTSPQKFNRFYIDFVKSRRVNWKELFSKNNYYKSLSTDLLSQKPLEALYPDRELYELAKCWAKESGEKGITGHNRISCPDVGRENCSYGYSKGLEIVMQLLIDDGIASLGHRTNILSSSKGLGAAIQPHTKYGSCSVLDFWGTNDKLKKLKAERASLFPELMKRWSPQEMKIVDAARSLNYLTDREKDFYMYINMIRVYPQKFKELFWDNGPYFDEDLEEQEEGIQMEPTYITAGQNLKTAGSGSALIPSEDLVKIGRCVGREMDRKNKFSLQNINCNTGQIEVSTYIPDDAYRFVVDQLLSEDFNVISKKGRILVFNEGTNFDTAITLYQLF